MPSKGYSVVLVSAVELHLGVDARLLPEGRHRSSDLDVAEHVPAHHHYLLTFAEISGMPFVVDSSGVVPGSSQFPVSPCNDVVIYFFSLQKSFKILDRALHQPYKPPLILHLQQLLSHIKIPKVRTASRVSSGEGLFAQTEVVVVAEVVSLFKQVIFEVLGVVVYLGLQFSLGLVSAPNQSDLPHLENIHSLDRTHSLAGVHHK